MKKVYLTLGLGGLMLGATAQSNINEAKPFPLQLATGKMMESPAQVGVKAPGDILWQDNFDTTANWVIDNGGQSVSGWFITNNAGVQGWPGFVSNGMSSSSGGNFAELYNGDPTTNNPAPIAGTFTLTTANPINLANAGVDLIIEQEGAKFQDNQDILVSIDGTTFVPLGGNADEDALTNTGGSQYPEPYEKKWDLGAALSGAGFTSGNIWIRFQWSPDVQNITYGWLIDDVRIVEKEGNDLSLDAVSWYHNTGSRADYSRVPVSQLAAMTFEGNVTNKGAFNQPNTTLDVVVSGAGTASVSSTPGPLAGSAVALLEAGTFTPSSTGTYTATYTISSDSTDSDVSNNSDTRTWEVTDFLYGKSDAALSGWYGALDGDQDGIDDPFEAILEYELNAPITLTGLQAVFAGGSTDGGEIYYNIYTLDAQGNFVPYFDGVVQPVPTTTISAAQTTTTGANWVTLEFPSAITFDPAQLNAPAIYAVVGWELDLMEIAVGGGRADTTAFIAIEQSTAGSATFFTQDNWMIDLYEGPVGIEEEAALDVSLGQSMPNPTNGTATIPFTLVNGGAVNFTVTDLTGKIIETRSLGYRPTGNHMIEFDGRNLSNGIYYYSVEINGQRSTKKLTISK